MKRLLIGMLLSTSLFAQDLIVNFFKYSTVYAGFNLSSPKWEDDRYSLSMIDPETGMENWLNGELQVHKKEMDLEPDFDLSFGIRKIARFNYEPKRGVKNAGVGGDWYKGNEVSPNEAAPLVKGGSNRTEGVRGAAAGGGFRFRYVADVLRVRAAIGKELGKSPQLVDAEQLRTLFDRFSDPLSPEMTDRDSFIRMVSALGIRLPPDEIRELIVDVDMDDSNQISFEEFEGWYRQVVGTGAVTVLHTEQAVDQVLSEEKGTGRCVVLKVGFTSCAPCKKFLPHFEQRALDFRENARFVRIYGNENASTIHLARDRLAVKTTPTFFVFKDGELMHSHSGANVDKFDDAVKEQIGELEEGTYEQNWEKPAVDDIVPSI